MAIEGFDVEENIETEPGDRASLRPTYEQIALRVYEIYLERGEKPGDEREDWLRVAKDKQFPPARPNSGLRVCTKCQSQFAEIAPWVLCDPKKSA